MWRNMWKSITSAFVKKSSVLKHSETFCMLCICNNSIKWMSRAVVAKCLRATKKAKKKISSSTLAAQVFMQMKMDVLFGCLLPAVFRRVFLSFSLLFGFCAIVLVYTPSLSSSHLGKVCAYSLRCRCLSIFFSFFVRKTASLPLPFLITSI